TGDGLTILTGGNTVLGLVLNGFSNNGIYIAPGANGNRIAGNFLGTDVTGTTAVPNDGSGVSVFSANNTIGGLTPTARNLISGNGLDGIGLTNAAATGNVVQGNYIGTDITGTNRLGNSRFGVAVNSVVGSGSASGSGNTIGGTGAGAGNVISANGSHGVVLNGPDGGATGNLVQGNLIGTDASGLLNLGNGGSGLVLSSAGSNTVGGTSAAARNVIAGSGRYGLVIEEASSSNNVILGNFIGTDGVGTAALGNALAGLIIQLGATGNTVGGAAGGGNLISGNLQGGVVITGVGTRANIVAANRIGTTANGQAALGNANNGVSIASGASGNTIGGTGESGNVISGNRGDGVSVNATGSVVQGNLIGLDSAGTAAVPNGVAGSGTGGAGVRLGAPSNLITDNVISGNVNEGMFVQSQANQQQILGNRIGTNAAGTQAIGNGLSGITLNQSSGNTINANVLSGNGVLPIGGVGLIAVAGSNNNLIQGNRVGTDLAGTRALPNSGGGLFIASVGNTIGGAGAGARNILSGNQGNGLVLSNNSGNSILNNFVGIASDGATPLGNSVDGLALNNSTGNVISGNVVSGNGVNLDGVGINLQNNSRNNTIAGNRVGTNAAGDAAVRNALHGIFLGNGSVNNTIGGPNAADRNIISGNGSFPVADLLTQGSVGVFISGAGSTGNVIAGNFIGTSADGNQPLTSSVIGVLIDQSPGNIVRGNLISGNRFVGLEIAGATASGNLVQGNLIGTNLAGNGAIPNRFDGVFLNGAPGNTIGGPGAGEGNLISGNGSVGIQLFGAATQGNVIQGNAIGLDSAGRPTLPNRSGGIFINGGATSNQIGGTAPGEANLGQSRPLGNFSPPRQSLQQSSKGMARLRLSRRSPVLRARPGFSARRLRPAH
ncbi:MAG: right-handed parallel beta-helix repeat-containing protein, partial [Isosphaeraceae bacterium]